MDQLLAQPQLPKFGQAGSDITRIPLSIVNAWFYGDRGEGDRFWVLIDAGLGASKATIQRMAAERFGPRSRPAAIILTHGHFDHVGTLPDLADEWDVPVYAHPLEFPYLTGLSSYPPPDPAVGGGLMSLLSRCFPRGPINLSPIIRELPGDGSVPGMPGWQWIHTPGHTPGHVSLFREADRALIAGDAFVTVRQESAVSALWQDGKVRRPPAYYTTDWNAAGESVRRLAALRPEFAATGHGPAISGPQLRQELMELATHWDQLARPSHGRYVQQAAQCDETGVLMVSPPVVDRQLVTLAGAAVGLLAVSALLRRST